MVLAVSFVSITTTIFFLVFFVCFTNPIEAGYIPVVTGLERRAEQVASIEAYYHIPVDEVFAWLRDMSLPGLRSEDLLLDPRVVMDDFGHVKSVTFYTVADERWNDAVIDLAKHKKLRRRVVHNETSSPSFNTRDLTQDFYTWYCGSSFTKSWFDGIATETLCYPLTGLI
jgi:hypothetical protein